MTRVQCLRGSLFVALMLLLLASASAEQGLPPTCVAKPTCNPDHKHCADPRLKCYLCGSFCTVQSWLCCLNGPLPDPRSVEGAGLVAWFDQVHNLCGEAFVGKVTTDEPGGDDSWSTHRLVMHVRECEENRLAIPLHVGDDRSRTWVLRRTGRGASLLKHDQPSRRDGGEDAFDALRRGWERPPRGVGALDFPGPTRRRRPLFVREGLDVSVDKRVGRWRSSPGKNASPYILRRPGRTLSRSIFDLSAPVDAPALRLGGASRSE